MPSTFEFCIPTRATKVPFGPEWLHRAAIPLEDLLAREQAFGIGDPGHRGGLVVFGGIIGAAVVKAYDWRHDVLYGPYIKGDD